MSARAVCGRRPGRGLCVAAAVMPAFNVRALFDRKLAFALVETQFEELTVEVEKATGIPKPMQYKLYGLFKQAVDGDAPSGPGLFGNKKKHEQWTAVEGMEKLQAMQKYINLALKYVASRRRSRRPTCMCAQAQNLTRRFFPRRPRHPRNNPADSSTKSSPPRRTPPHTTHTRRPTPSDRRILKPKTPSSLSPRRPADNRDPHGLRERERGHNIDIRPAARAPPRAQLSHLARPRADRAERAAEPGDGRLERGGLPRIAARPQQRRR